MSFILNALRKSEQERLASQSVSLGDRILENQAFVEKKKSPWLAILALANVLIVCFFIWHYFRGKEPENNEIKQPVLNVMKKPLIPESPGIQVSNKTNAAVSKQADSDIENISISEQLKRQNIKNKAHKKKIKIAKTKVPQKAKPKTKPDNKISKIEKPITSTPVQQPKPKVVSNISNDPPFLTELSYSFRRTVPDIRINVFVYSENEKERFIMVNMKKYHPGQQIDGEMELKEIRRNSVVVEYNNKIFQIQR